MALIDLSLHGFASKVKIRSMFSRTKYFLLACGKLMEAVVAKAERSEEFELDQFKSFFLIAHDLGLALSALTEDSHRDPRSPRQGIRSKGLTLQDGVFFTHGREELMSLDEVNRKWTQEFFTRLLQDSDEVGLKGIQFGELFCKHLDTNGTCGCWRCSLLTDSVRFSLVVLEYTILSCEPSVDPRSV